MVIRKVILNTPPHGVPPWFSVLVRRISDHLWDRYPILHERWLVPPDIPPDGAHAWEIVFGVDAAHRDDYIEAVKHLPKGELERVSRPHDMCTATLSLGPDERRIDVFCPRITHEDSTPRIAIPVTAEEKDEFCNDPPGHRITDQIEQVVVSCCG